MSKLQLDRSGLLLVVHPRGHVSVLSMYAVRREMEGRSVREGSESFGEYSCDDVIEFVTHTCRECSIRVIASYTL